MIGSPAASMNVTASSKQTQERLQWRPTLPGLIADLAADPELAEINAIQALFLPTCTVTRRTNTDAVGQPTGGQ